MPQPLRFGANYVPSAGWFYGWLDYDGDAVRRDFEDIAGLGLDHVRVFPIWPWIQPNRSLIRQRGIDDLLDTIDAAAEFGLSVSVDLLQGHLSSFDFLPSWVLTWHQRSVFSDREVRDGIAAYVARVSEQVASRSNVFALTLGNEVDNLWPSNETTPEASGRWATELVEVARKKAPHSLALHSVYDATWYQPAHPFHPTDAVNIGDLTTVHSWVFNGVSSLDGPLGPATTSHADYLVELAAATSADPLRPVWLQEVGAPGPDIPADDAAEFTREMLRQVVTNPALYGVTWWCSHDVDRKLVDFPEREYDLGLFTTDHRSKPAARELAAFVKEARDRPAPRPAMLCDVDLATEPHRRAEVAPGSDFHTEWVQLRQTGPVAIVHPWRATDPDYLMARNIDRVIHID